ncbi:MAG: sigma-70 family RNA polymerase sigma factor [Solirubrobacteraceae bacterium]
MGEAVDWTSRVEAEFKLRLGAELPRLLSFARRLMQDDDDARDLVQDALERAWRSRRQLQDPAAAGAWLRSIVAHRAVDLQRRGRDRLVDFDEALEAPLLPDVHDPAAVIAAAEDHAAVRAALRSLSNADRLAVVLHDGEGWSAMEIAQLMQTSVEAAHKRIQRARVRLVTSLAQGHTATSVPAESCRAARAGAHELLDGDSDNVRLAAVRRHLDTCLACPASLQAAAAVLAQLGVGADDPGTLDEGLRQRLLELVSQTEPGVSTQSD